MRVTRARRTARFMAAMVGSLFLVLTLDVTGTRLCHMLQQTAAPASPLATPASAAPHVARHHAGMHHADAVDAPAPSAPAPAPAPEHPPHPCDCPQQVTPALALPPQARVHLVAALPLPSAPAAQPSAPIPPASRPPYLQPPAQAPPLA